MSALESAERGGRWEACMCVCVWWWWWWWWYVRVRSPPTHTERAAVLAGYAAALERGRAGQHADAAPVEAGR